MAIFWVVEPGSLAEVYRRLRSACVSIIRATMMPSKTAPKLCIISIICLATSNALSSSLSSVANFDEQCFGGTSNECTTRPLRLN
jgi:hypothetical protein